MARFSIGKWRKKAISLYGKSRGLTAEQRAEVTAAVHGKSSRSLTKSRRTSVKRGGTMAKRSRRAKRSKKGGSRGSRILGSMGAKGIVIATVLLSATKYLTRKFFPQAGAYTTGVSMTGAGIAAKAINTPGKTLLAPGIVELVSEFVVDMVQPNGAYTLPMFAATTKGYDY